MSFDKRIDIRERILMGPGPSNIHPRVLKAMSQQVIGHLDEQFVQMSKEIKYMLQHIFQTRNELTLAISGPGSAGMETCLVNLLEPGDEALICINGVFGERMADMADRCGAKVFKIEAEWGEIIEPEQIQEALKKCSPKVIAIVHAETSSGVLQPLEKIGKIAKEVDALFVVDAVASFAGTEIKMDDWEIDAIYASTQKCLGAPPGMSPISFSQKAVNAAINRKVRVQSWLLDITLLKECMDDGKRFHAYTAPVSNTYSLYEALKMVIEEGLEKRFARHIERHVRLKKGLSGLELEFTVKLENRIPYVNIIKVPDQIDDHDFRNRLKSAYGIEIAGGLDKSKGKVWRIGLMGEACRIRNIDLLLNAMHTLLSESKIISI